MTNTSKWCVMTNDENKIRGHLESLFIGFPIIVAMDSNHCVVLDVRVLRENNNTRANPKAFIFSVRFQNSLQPNREVLWLSSEQLEERQNYSERRWMHFKTSQYSDKKSPMCRIGISSLSQSSVLPTCSRVQHHQHHICFSRRTVNFVHLYWRQQHSSLSSHSCR